MKATFNKQRHLLGTNAVAEHLLSFEFFFQTNLTCHFLGLKCHSERIKKISMNHKTIIS